MSHEKNLAIVLKSEIISIAIQIHKQLMIQIEIEFYENKCLKEKIAISSFLSSTLKDILKSPDFIC